MRTYDLLVVGSGPAGTYAAIRARRAGRTAAVIERRGLVGGRCVHTGTIPSKTLRQAVMDVAGFRQWSPEGASPRSRPRVAMATLRERCEQVIAAEVAFEHRLFGARGIDMVIGEARFLDPHTLRVEGPEGTVDVRGDRVLLAVGSEPHHPPEIPFDGRRILDSDQIIGLPELPRSLVVVGGGVIGCEYASIFSLLDMEVTLIHRSANLMSFVDDTLIEALETNLDERRVRLRKGVTVSKYTTAERGVRLDLSDGTALEAEAVLYCAGRIGSAPGLDLERAGLRADAKGCLPVDAEFRTAVPHIHAAGDVVGYPSLASVSREQGRVAACRALGVNCRPLEPLLPYGVWTVPEIAMVGVTEKEAKQKGLDFAVGLGRYEDTARGQIIGDRSGILKLVVDRGSRKILGAHLLGTGAAELVHLAQMAITYEATYLFFVRMVMNYPTLSRVYKVAAWDLLEKLGD